MAEFIVFKGQNKRESVKKAINFYYDNYNFGLHMFLAKCRTQPDGITVHYYPNMVVSISKVDKKEDNEKKYSPRYRWSLGRFLLWIRSIFE